MYRVTFTYTVDVDEADAADRDEAMEVAFSQFIDDGGYTDAYVEVEEIEEGK